MAFGDILMDHQFDDPAAPGYTTVMHPMVRSLMSWDMRRNIRPWNKSLYIRCLRFLRGRPDCYYFRRSVGGIARLVATDILRVRVSFQITVDPFATQDFIAAPPIIQPLQWCPMCRQIGKRYCRRCAGQTKRSACRLKAMMGQPVKPA